MTPDSAAIPVASPRHVRKSRFVPIPRTLADPAEKARIPGKVAAECQSHRHAGAPLQLYVTDVSLVVLNYRTYIVKQVLSRWDCRNPEWRP